MSDSARSFRVFRAPIGWVFSLLAAVAMTGSGGLAKAAGDFLSVDGGSIYYEVSGPRPTAGPIGFALVLIHDGTAHSVVWDAQVAEFSRDYTVIRYDRRGYGRSPQPTAPYSNVADLNALLTALQVQRAVLIGASAGGGLAIDYTLSYPNQIEALVLCGPVVNGLGYSQHFMERAYANFTGDPDTTLELWIKDRYIIAPGNEDARERLRAILRAAPHDLDSQKHRWLQEPEQAALPRLDEIAAPTLLVTGDQDIPDVHAHMGAIEAGIAGARREVIHNAGHLCFFEQPEVFDDMVAEFLSLLALDPGNPRLASLVTPDAASTWSTFTDGFITVPGTAIYYQMMGPLQGRSVTSGAASRDVSPGEAIVFIHGGSLDHRMWDAQFAALATGYRVIRYDVRGHGLTQSPFGIYRNYEDLHALLDHFGVERAHLVGLSLGCRIAVDCAIAHPERVASLVLASPGLSGARFDAPEEQACESAIVAAWMKGDFAQAAEEFVRGWCDGPQRTPEQVPRAVREAVKRMGVANMRPNQEFGRGVELDPPAIGRLSEVHAPTLAILGQLDMPGIHTIVRSIGETVPGARVETFENAAHMVSLEDPQRFNSLLLEFLAGL